MKQMICALFAVMCFFIAVGAVGYIENHYTRKDCVVVSVCGDSVRAKDKCGFVWSFEGSGYRVGEEVNLKMHTNYTSGDVSDDYVVGAN